MAEKFPVTLWFQSIEERPFDPSRWSVNKTIHACSWDEAGEHDVTAGLAHELQSEAYLHSLILGDERAYLLASALLRWIAERAPWEQRNPTGETETNNITHERG
jgi:hypothetical protein